MRHGAHPIKHNMRPGTNAPRSSTQPSWPPPQIIATDSRSRPRTVWATFVASSIGGKGKGCSPSEAAAPRLSNAAQGKMGAEGKGHGNGNGARRLDQGDGMTRIRAKPFVLVMTYPRPCPVRSSSNAHPPRGRQRPRVAHQRGWEINESRGVLECQRDADSPQQLWPRPGHGKIPATSHERGG